MRLITNNFTLSSHTKVLVKECRNITSLSCAVVAYRLETVKTRWDQIKAHCLEYPARYQIIPTKHNLISDGVFFAVYYLPMLYGIDYK
jgi:hypothetical protein